MGTAENPDFSYGVCKRSLSYDNIGHLMLCCNQIKTSKKIHLKL